MRAPAWERISPKLGFARVPERSLSQAILHFPMESSPDMLAEVLCGAAKQSFEVRRDQAGAWSLKRECIRPTCPASLDEARQRVATFVEHYNTVRLHSAIGYITPQDMLNGLAKTIHDDRDRKLEQARDRRQLARHQTPGASPANASLTTEVA